MNLGWAWGGVGFGVGWGGVITYVALASSLTCYATYLLRDNMRMGWGGVITYVAFGTLMKSAVPNSLSSHTNGKASPLMWEYIRSQQWRWELGSESLLVKTGQALAKL